MSKLTIRAREEIRIFERPSSTTSEELVAECENQEERIEELQQQVTDLNREVAKYKENYRKEIEVTLRLVKKLNGQSADTVLDFINELITDLGHTPDYLFKKKVLYTEQLERGES